MIIKVLGPGCKNCQLLLTNVTVALQRLKLVETIEYVKDLAAISDYGILRTPGLVINDQLVLQGKVLSPIELEALLLAHNDHS